MSTKKITISILSSLIFFSCGRKNKNIAADPDKPDIFNENET